METIDTIITWILGIVLESFIILSVWGCIKYANRITSDNPWKGTKYDSEPIDKIVITIEHVKKSEDETPEEETPEKEPGESPPAN